jgi:hypothetical protein
MLCAPALTSHKRHILSSTKKYRTYCRCLASHVSFQFGQARKAGVWSSTGTSVHGALSGCIWGQPFDVKHYSGPFTGSAQRCCTTDPRTVHRLKLYNALSWARTVSGKSRSASTITIPQAMLVALISEIHLDIFAFVRIGGSLLFDVS